MVDRTYVNREVTPFVCIMKLFSSQFLKTKKNRKKSRKKSELNQLEFGNSCIPFHILKEPLCNKALRTMYPYSY